MKKSLSTPESNNNSKSDDERSLRRHIIITSLWFITAFALAFIAHFGSESKDIKPSEIGDLLAGVASPAALYWLIVGFFLQRTELKLQREELELARKQFTRQASALEETSALHQKTLSLNERGTEHSELQQMLGTIPTRMEPVTNFLRTLKELNTSNNSLKIGFLNFRSKDPDQKTLIDYFARSASGWLDESYGPLIECMKLTKPHDFYNFERELNDLKRWFNEANHRALRAEAPFFYQGCKQVKLILLLETFNNIMEPDVEWGLHIGSDL